MKMVDDVVFSYSWVDEKKYVMADCSRILPVLLFPGNTYVNL